MLVFFYYHNNNIIKTNNGLQINWKENKCLTKYMFRETNKRENVFSLVEKAK